MSRITRNDAGVRNPRPRHRRRRAGPADRGDRAGAWGDNLFVRVQDAAKQSPGGTEFRITILYYRTPPPLPLVDPLDPDNVADPNRREPDVIEDYEPLGDDPIGSRLCPDDRNAASRLVQARWSDETVAANRPTNVGFTQLQNGADGANAVTAAEYVGDPTQPTDERAGLAALEAIDEIALLACPTRCTRALNAANQAQVTNELVNQCERLRDRFAVLAVGAGQGDVAQIRTPRDSSYAAIYYPWIRVFDPPTADTCWCRPGPRARHLRPHRHRARRAQGAGQRRGPRHHHARPRSTPKPARVPGHQGPARHPQPARHRRHPRLPRRTGAGSACGAARTMSADAQWHYVNVRRLFIFVEESIDEGTQWVVFEPQRREHVGARACAASRTS